MNCDRTWAEISLSAVSHNYSVLKKHSGKEIMAVVKADAYGHGSVPVAWQLQNGGADYFAVATADEALALREDGIQVPILVMGYVAPVMIREITARDIAVAVFDLEQAKSLSQAALPSAPVKAHFKRDTGMSRLGFTTDEDLFKALELPNLLHEGLFTHYSCADTAEDAFTFEQSKRFSATVNNLHNAGYNFAKIHCANSGGVIYYHSIPGNMARVGIALYGYLPNDESGIPPLIPAMRWCASVAQVKTISRGDSVSYGRHFTAEGDMRIAILACGYADGYLRAFSNKGEVLIHGKRARVLGSVCMDMMIVDVTSVTGAKSGDRAVLLGCDGGECVSPYELAGIANTIPYEILCSVSARVPRVYE